MKDKIFIYADEDSPISDDVPDISMPYKDVKQFLKENPSLKPWKSYSLSNLLEVWGVEKELEQLFEEAMKLEDVGKHQISYVMKRLKKLKAEK